MKLSAPQKPIPIQNIDELRREAAAGNCADFKPFSGQVLDGLPRFNDDFLQATRSK